MVTDGQVRKLFRDFESEMCLAVAARRAGMDEKTARKYRSLGAHGQRTLILLQRKNFRQERCVQHTADHLAAEAVFAGMALEHGYGEAAQPA